ncbi:EamA family transporter [Tumebacillus permanentifrigoris]|uniref:Threonine/homoserine efflux transporter RhtA n=1 Tax=Tumebacillus permanentifrigoris TaxID=378543 RepID=A0A316D6U8_9BACL|nr:DMT family transporter [Tumebacillus permanentifrigoris]PWK09697.1 threonine/homoserine efflux transporter RhtA [Tumebacillus permanentifrigoris]
MNRTLAIILVLIGGASYGLISPAVKMAYDAGFSPADVTSSQYFAAMAVLVVIALFQLRHLRNLTRRDLLLLSFLGLLSTGTSVFYYLSLSYLPASLAIVLLFQFTWVVMVIDFFVARNKPTPVKWLALALIFFGTLFAVDLLHSEWGDVSVLGLTLGFLSSLTYGAFLYFTSYVRAGSSPFLNSALISIVSTFVVFLIFPPTFLWNGSLGAGLWVWALIIGGLGQVIPPVLFNIGIPKIGGALAAVLGAIELPVAVISAYLLLHEAVVGVQWIGIVLILVGIVVTELRLVRKRTQLT